MGSNTDLRTQPDRVNTMPFGYFKAGHILFVYWEIFHAFMPSADFLKMNFFEKFFQECHQCQTVWSQIRTNILCGLVWVQIVCKRYQQTTLVGKEFTMYFTIISMVTEDMAMFMLGPDTILRSFSNISMLLRPEKRKIMFHFLFYF